MAAAAMAMVSMLLPRTILSGRIGSIMNVGSYVMQDGIFVTCVMTLDSSLVSSEAIEQQQRVV